MIFGIGTDICAIKRIAKIHQRYGRRFTHRILAPCEQDEYAKLAKRQSKQQVERFLAKRFATKEALVKAIHGSNGLSWHDAWVSHQPNGVPFVGVSPKLAKHLPQNAKIHLSLSDEHQYAVAMVVIALEIALIST